MKVNIILVPHFDQQRPHPHSIWKEIYSWKVFFISDALRFRITQSTPFTLASVVYFFNIVSFTTFFVGVIMVFWSGDYIGFTNWKEIFQFYWDYDLSLPFLTIDVSCGSTFLNAIVSFALTRGIGWSSNWKLLVWSLCCPKKVENILLISLRAWVWTIQHRGNFGI